MITLTMKKLILIYILFLVTNLMNCNTVKVYERKTGSFDILNEVTAK